MAGSMKDCHHIALRPQYHWTDQKVEVHVFCCVLALMLCSLMRRKLHRKGIDRSIPDILDELAKLREADVVYAPQGEKETPTIQMTLSQMSAEQRSLFEALDLPNGTATKQRMSYRNGTNPVTKSNSCPKRAVNSG